MNPDPPGDIFEGLPAVDGKERLLLQAAILPRKEARAAWEQFCHLTPDIEKAAESAFNYFPAIAVRLADNADPVEHVRRLQSVLRHSWARRQFVLSRLLPVFQKLNEKKIEFILLKGLAISFSYQPYRGERSLIDVGLLVTSKDLPPALSLLEAAGWRVISQDITSSSGASIYRPPEIRLSHPSGESLAVQTWLFPRAVEGSLWKEAVDSGFQGVTIRLLDRLHRFLSTCLLASPRDSMLEFNPGLVDAAHFLTPNFPWLRLESVAHRFGVRASVRRVLLALAEGGLALPERIVPHWREIQIQPDEQDLLATRSKERESRPPLRRYLSRERTRAHAETYLQRHAPAGFFPFWQAASAYVRREYHLRAYNRRAYYYILILLGRVRKMRK